jgi:hypothetical protein
MEWLEPQDFSKHLRKAMTPAEYLLWQRLRHRQRCHAKQARINCTSISLTIPLKKRLTAKGLSSEVVSRRESFQPSSDTGTVSTANLRLVSDPISHVVDLIVERFSQLFI